MRRHAAPGGGGVGGEEGRVLAVYITGRFGVFFWG